MIQLKRFFGRWIRHGALFGLTLATLTPAVQAQVSFSPPQNVSNSPGASAYQQIAVDSAGNINIVWQDKTPSNYDIFFSQSDDGGATFSAPRTSPFSS